jgi:preprotein translocase subunit SecD
VRAAVFARSGKAGLSGLFLWCGLLLAGIGATTATAADLLLIEVTRAEMGFDRATGEPIVSFTMTENSRRQFAEFTARNVGRTTDFRVDGRSIMKPVIREPIVGGTSQIAGGFNANDAREMAARLSSGAAKIEVEIVPE